MTQMSQVVKCASKVKIGSVIVSSTLATQTPVLIIRVLLAVVLATMAAKAQGGVNITILHGFGVSDSGNAPFGLVQGGDGNFYGTTERGGTHGAGTIFKINASGSLTYLYSFIGGNDGDGPNALVQGRDGNFYGTTSYGGTNGRGTVFKISASGSLTSLYSFTGGFTGRNDGNHPFALVQGSDGNFYGTTLAGGSTNNAGTVFKISASGSLATLYTFNGGNDGGLPNALVQGSDGNFYGTTGSGGTNRVGIVFKISPSGSLIFLYTFTGGNDGSDPSALVQGGDGNFYGTTSGGGTNGQGTVFKISTSGSLTSLYSFTGGNDGSGPSALVQGSDGNFYGTTGGGGTGTINGGTVFKISASGSLTSLNSFNGGSALVQGSDGNFYGMASGGGAAGYGTIFKINSSGSLTSLYSFGGNDGETPMAGLVQGGDGNFYGTTSGGGPTDNGTVFKISASGSLTTLYSFTGGYDGRAPTSRLVQGSDGNFYGTTSDVTNGYGTVFKISAGGLLTTLYSFINFSDGDMPNGLVQGGGSNFYGTTSGGGTNGQGTVFKISASGSLTTLYSFTGGNDGGFPWAGLTQGTNGNFYGTTYFGGSNGYGTVFKISVSGSLTSLYSFTGSNDGQYPQAGLVQGTDGIFYGTTSSGGSDYGGTVFKISASGSLTPLHTFTGQNDGEFPRAGLAQGNDGNFYGTTSTGGTNRFGTVFKISDSGSLTTLYSFAGGIDGGSSLFGAGSPLAGLVQGRDGNFYGTTLDGGVSGEGVVFSISVSSGPAPLSIAPNGAAFGLTAGVFGFNIVGPSGSNVVVQGSTDLKTWISLQTNLFGNAPLYFSDPLSPTNAHHFYRAVLR
jgi:uncharacterized repeat protein (TIGR03803 family)